MSDENLNRFIKYILPLSNDLTIKDTAVYAINLSKELIAKTRNNRLL